MNEIEASQLLTYCAAFDNRNPSEAAAAAWASALYNVPLDADTKAAVNAYYTTSPKDPDGRLWIMPHHVRTLRTSIRAKRLENFQYEPAGDETTAGYLTRYRGQVQAIASGRAPASVTRPALEGAPSREFMEELEARGWKGMRAVPEDDGAAAGVSRRVGPLRVVCPTCGATPGKPCKRPGGSEKHPLGKPRLRPHGARLAATEGPSGGYVEERGAEERRIRALSARHLARQEES